MKHFLESRLRWWIPSLLVLVVFACFWPALSGEFVHWDDYENFVRNPHLAAGDLKWVFTTSEGHYMPLTWLSLFLDYGIWKLDPFGYHLTNLLLHCGNTLLFYFLLLALLREKTVATCFFAAAGALLFAIHPLRVEVVAWATERRELLSGLFFLLTIHAYLRGRRVVSVILFVCTLLSKATGMMLPLVLLVIDVWPLGRTDWKKLLVQKVPYLGFTLLYVGLTYVSQTQANAMWTVEEYGLLERATQPGFRFSFYLWKTILPIDLSPLYLYRSAPPGVGVLVGWLVLITKDHRP